ncbi:MAG: hypothetical protein HY341_01440 [Candidatus Kerfeldbacteria bacterium]|nr:hypothetical protein [Candidatus Kerfeldbacteria bacterium]
MVVGERSLTFLYHGQWVAAEYERISGHTPRACAFCGNTGHDVVVDRVSVDAVYPTGERVPYASADGVRHLVQAILHADIPHCHACAHTLDARRCLLLEAFDGQAPTTW